MKPIFALATVSMALALAPASWSASFGPRFYGDPPDANHPWAVHDGNRPQPRVVTPGTFSTQEQAGKPPADAIILFDGTDLSKWEGSKGAPAKWEVKDGYMQVVPGTGEIRSKEAFGDCQLHVEWAAPSVVKGDSQGRGNSGIFLMGMLEVQVLDCYNNPTYADGTAGGYYGVNPPLVNAVRPPGQFQVYDIVFRRPIYKDGKVLDPGYVTVFVNGILVQDHTPLEGSGGHMGRSKVGPFPEKGAMRLQDHNNTTRFRNIWYRPLPPRMSEGGTDGFLAPEVAQAKRKEIAATVRANATKLANPANPVPQLLDLLESLVYEADAATVQQVEKMTADYLAAVRQLPAEKVAGKKNDTRELANAFKYLTRFKILPADCAAKAGVDKLIVEQGWADKKK
jgi:hypothetical protein